ncbi:MAG TPA: tagaturonate reductase [Candidatus Avimonoglobus intestinipullorum]|uniref:Tagaturonate reductase n=1 Tax=Candidatus Avimonoglobus intestinipullorum TaxID=2840699 RepID=A0A9D1S6N5_9FIRM|nr:tagaturonate reductase [Candidatus Avimonoglobus intestinipullorum]
MSTTETNIIQFGEGGFLRAFVDWMIQILNEKTDFCGKVTVVQPIREGLCDVLAAQNGRYTLIMRGAEGMEKRIIDVIANCVKPYDAFDQYLALAEDPSYRFVVSNTTEAGIAYREGDRPEDMPPESFPAKVAVLLKRRFDLGLPGFVFLPCELIDKNGENLRRIVLQYAKEWGYPAEFIDWVERENVFCNTLVDRIVTGYPKDEEIETEFPDRMIDTSEYFHLWVIEGPQALLQELPFDKAGLNVIVTADLERYRTRKVRILNGAHTSLVPYALLNGFETVKECVDDPKMGQFLQDCIFEEIIPTLDLPEAELKDYAENVLVRFANPYIKHYLTSIALNSISKFRVRVLPSILEYQRRFAKFPEHLVFAFAMLLRFYRVGEPKDDPALIDIIRTAPLRDVLRNTTLWGQSLEFLYEEVAQYENS